MGGIFSSPNPPAPVVAPPAEDPAEAAAQAARDRRRRAQGETIATSYRGVTEAMTASAQPQRKSLIGE